MLTPSLKWHNYDRKQAMAHSSFQLTPIGCSWYMQCFTDPKLHSSTSMWGDSVARHVAFSMADTEASQRLSGLPLQLRSRLNGVFTQVPVSNSDLKHRKLAISRQTHKERRYWKQVSLCGYPIRWKSTGNLANQSACSFPTLKLAESRKWNKSKYMSTDWHHNLSVQ